MTAEMGDPFSDLFPAGRPPGDPFLTPYVQSDDSFLLEDGETVLHSGDYFVEIHVHAYRPSSGKKQWHTVAPFRKRGFAAVTTDRLLFCWPQFRNDPGAGSLFERLSVRYLEHSEGVHHVFGGHFRHQWVGNVFVRKPYGWKGESGVTIQTEDRDGNPYRLAVRGLTPSVAQSVGRDFAKAVASHRLELWADASDEACAALAALSAGSAVPVDRGWAWDYSIPGGRRVGFDFPRATERQVPDESSDSFKEATKPAASVMPLGAAGDEAEGGVEAERPGSRVCVTGSCEAFGLSTSLTTCDLCGSHTQTR